MSKYAQKSRIMLLSSIMSLMAGFPLLADDTEVYIGDLDFSTTIRPNVVFIIDTSGSMSADVELIQGVYDPATTYAGECSSDYVYWSTDGNAPGCNKDKNHIEVDSNVCADSFSALSNTGPGYYTGTVARYKVAKYAEDRWDDLNPNDSTGIIECAADYGVHGNGSNDDHYPADAHDGGPFIDMDTDAINWNNTGQVATLYSSNYLNWLESHGVVETRSRLEIVQGALKGLIDSTSGINAALMRFDDDQGPYIWTNPQENRGGYFVMPMQELNAASRPAFKDAIDGMTAQGYTPLAESLYEVARYYRGEAVKFGNETSPGTNVDGVLDPDNTNSYLSPVTWHCQQNYAVVLTDGIPTYDSDADEDINALPNFTDIAGSCQYEGTGSENESDCLDELADYLYNYDQLDGDDMPDTQNVITHTIGFLIDDPLLQLTANKGGGNYHLADDALQLTSAFNQIIADILEVNATFVAPAVPVNAFNRLTNRDELYFALFRPAKYPRWAGNLKRYQLAGDPPFLADANGVPAVDPSTGYFAADSTSFWTSGDDAPDGDDIRKGGAAGELTLARNMYTYSGDTAPANENLAAAANSFSELNASVTKDMLGDAGMEDDYRTNLMKWTRGVDLFDSDEDGDTTDARRRMADPLHSNPVLVNYGGTEDNPDITLYVATNEGLLHAINTADGSEVFSFIPQELLPNLNILYNNNAANSHPYGLDGPLTVWANDANNNGVLQDGAGNTEAGEYAYLYAGMRRGGSNYYALNITERNTPRLMWMIEGGQGDYTELGQTWSKTTLGHIKSGGNRQTVLIFGGGYDVNQDDENAGVDSQGRALYLADATTGSRVWWAGPNGSGANLALADMEYSIPGNVAAGDIDFDGYTDAAFIAYMGGQIWRFDFDNSGDDTVITGGVVARLAGDGDGENRRFYVKPDISLIRINGAIHFALAIGSGYRAHPLNTETQDRFHMLLLEDAYTAPAEYSAIEEDDLVDVTHDLNPDMSAGQGWYLDLEAGEKVMANSLTVDGTVLFTTYTPPSANIENSCAPSQGTGRVYAINAYDARPVKNLDSVGELDELTANDRFKNLIRGGIQPEPRIIFTDDDKPVLLVGPEKIPDLDLNNPLRRTSWTDEE